MNVCIKYKCYISIELVFLKTFMLIMQVNQEKGMIVTIAVLDKGFKFQSYVCNKRHNLLMMSMNLKGSDY